MSNWSNLPIEILNNIFEGLHRKDVIQCSHTCRTWKTAAQRIFFKTIPSLTEEKLKILSSALSLYQGGLPRNFCRQSPGNFVKFLDCGKLTGSFDVSSLDRSFPFLEVIKIDPDQQIIYKKFHALMMNGSFPNLKEIPCATWNNAHAELVLNRKDNIQRLHLQVISATDDATYKVMQNLHLFSRLEKFALQYRNDKKEVCLAYLFSKDYPRLNSIELVFLPFSKLSLYTSLLDINAVQPLSNVKYFTTNTHHQFFYGGDKSFQFIMKKLPNVEILNLHESSTNVFQSHDFTIPSRTCVNQFLKYLSNIKTKASVGPILTDNYTAEIVENYLKYALFQGALTDKNIVLNLSIVLESMIEGQEHHYCLDRLAYMDVYNDNNHARNFCHTKLVYKLTQDGSPHLYHQLVRKIKNIKINKLTLGDESGHNIVPPHVPVDLNSIFDHLTKLKVLCLYRIADLNLSAREHIISLDLEHLMIRYCYIPTYMLPLISNKCTNLKSVEIRHCLFISHNNDPPLPPRAVARIVPLVMPSSSLQNFKLIISLRNYFGLFNFDKAFVRLATTNSKTRYCCIALEACSGKINYCDDKCTEADYQLLLKDKLCIVFDIQCQAVTVLSIINHDDNHPEEHGNRVYVEELL